MPVCPRCRSANPRDQATCYYCGQPLAANPRGAPAAPDAPFAPYAPPALPYAGILPRLGALVLDIMVTAGGGYALGIAVSLTWFAVVVGGGGTAEDAERSLEAHDYAFVLLGLALSLSYWWIGDALGGTLGKRAFGLRVVSASDGRALGLPDGFLRALVKLIGSLPLYLGWLWALWDGRGQAWHDKAAGSVVVKAVRTPASGEPHTEEGTHPSGDITPLPD